MQQKHSVIPFCFDSNQIRTLVDNDGNPMFVAIDVAKALGYSDSTNAIKRHCRGVAKRHPIVDSKGRTQVVRVIYEPDLYRLIICSKLPAAERFERWVFEEVLPQIRQTGCYSIQAEHDRNLAKVIRGAVRAELAAERKRRPVDPWLLDMLARNSHENMAIIYTALPMIDSGIPFSWTINTQQVLNGQTA